MELFLNPWYMVAGGALVSSPVIIHLINRMRFRRIRWAAMEFLLKSQKRNRRRLIIEQLILLFLRILLVLLAGFLVARFVGQALGLTPTSSTNHVVLLDDTLSMSDRSPKGAAGPDCFAVAKERINALAKYAAQANSAQYLTVVRLSNGEEVFKDRLNDDALFRLNNALLNLEPTAMHVAPLEGVTLASKLLGESLESKRWLHVVSDFRDKDWGRRPATDALHKLLNEVAETGANITLIDTADPERPTTGPNRAAEHHNNYAITDFRPEKRVAPSGTVVPFYVTIKNFGKETKSSVFLEVFLNGREDLIASKIYDLPAPGDEITHKFELVLEGPGAEQKSRYHRLTARLKGLDPASGLAADNVRHCVIEVREEVPTLVIDGSPEEAVRPGGDLLSVRTALESAKGNERTVVIPKEGEQLKTVEELKRPDLAREYATIYLLNLPNLKGKKDDKGQGEHLPLKNLREYVRNGGNVVFFMGDRVDVDYYNKVLFEANQGFFPIPLDQQASTRLNETQMLERRGSDAPKIYVLDDEHTVTAGLAEVQYKIPDLLIPQHAVAKERFEWTKPEWSREEDIKELITLANLKKLDDAAREQTQRLLKRIPLDPTKVPIPASRKADKSKPEERQQEQKYREQLVKALQAHLDLIKQELLGRPDQMYRVANALLNMVNDRGPKPGEKDNVSLAEFFSLAQMRDIKSDILQFRKDSLYGSPLVVSRRYGKGNVVAFLTTAGTKWSGWPGGSFEQGGGAASFTYPMIMVDLQKYLTRGGDGGQRLVGDKVTLELDAERYQNKAQRFKQADQGKLGENGAEEAPADAPAGFQPEPERTATATAGKYSFTFENPSESGVQFIRLYPQGEEGKYEERWFVFNVETETESDLRRAVSDHIERNPPDAPVTRGKIIWVIPEESQDLLRERQSDLSESPWLYILILIVLIAEQALAVHLSFHVRSGESAAPQAATPVPAPAAAA